MVQPGWQRWLEAEYRQRLGAGEIWAVGVWGGRGPPAGLKMVPTPTSGWFCAPLGSHSPSRGGLCCTENSLLPETAAASQSAPELDPAPQAPPSCRRLYAPDPSAPSPAGSDLRCNHVRSEPPPVLNCVCARSLPADLPVPSRTPPPEGDVLEAMPNDSGNCRCECLPRI